MTFFRLFKHVAPVFALIGLAYGQSPVTPPELISLTTSDITQDFEKVGPYTFTLNLTRWSNFTFAEVAVSTADGTYVGHIKCIIEGTRYYVSLLEEELPFRKQNLGALLLTWAKQQAQQQQLSLDLIAYPFLHASPEDVPQEERVKRLDKLVTFYKKHGGIERSRNLAGYTASIEFPYAIQA